MREVDEPQNAEHERQPDRTEREVSSGDDAVDRSLRRVVRALRRDECDGDQQPRSEDAQPERHGGGAARQRAQLRSPHPRGRRGRGDRFLWHKLRQSA